MTWRTMPIEPKAPGPLGRYVYVGASSGLQVGSPLRNPFVRPEEGGYMDPGEASPTLAYRHWLLRQLSRPTSPQCQEIAALALRPDGVLWCLCGRSECHAKVVAKAIDWFRATQPLCIPMLTLTQPWASLMAIGAKKIETRSWSERWRGLLGIHAGMGLAGMRRHEFEELYEEFALPLQAAGIMSAAELPRGYVLMVGEVRTIERITAENTPPEPERSYGNYEPGRYAWHVDMLRRLPSPVAMGGKQKLWWGTLPAGSWWTPPPTADELYPAPTIEDWIAGVR